MTDIPAITVPLPDRRLSPNARVHWGIRARLAREQRTTVAELARATMQYRRPELARVTATVTWYHGKGGRHNDPDNLAAMLKSTWDGLQDAGVLTDDRHLRVLPIEQRTDDRANPRVEIQLVRTCHEKRTDAS